MSPKGRNSYSFKKIVFPEKRIEFKNKIYTQLAFQESTRAERDCNTTDDNPVSVNNSLANGEEAIMEILQVKFESGDRGPIGRRTGSKFAIPEKGFKPILGDFYEVEVVKDTAPGERRGVLIVRPLKNLSDEKRREKEILGKRAETARYDIREAPGAEYEPMPGTRENLKWRGHFGGDRYDQFPRIWARCWGVNAPEEFFTRPRKERGTVIFSHMKVNAAQQAVSSGIPHEIMQLHQNGILAAEKAAGVLEEEIKARLPQCEMIYHSARDPFSIWDDNDDISVEEWSTRADGMSIADVAKPGELEQIKQARDRGKAYRGWKVKVDPQTRCGFDLEGTATFVLVATIQGGFGKEEEVVRVEGSALLKDLPQAILAAGEELFLIVEAKFKEKFAF